MKSNFFSSDEYKDIKQGYFTDQYFNNTRHILEVLSQEKYRFSGSTKFSNKKLTEKPLDVGNMEVDMQFFAKRKPFCLFTGLPIALDIIKNCAGHYKNGKFYKAKDLTIRAVPEGSKLKPWDTALRIQGKYKDIAHLETVLLGLFTRGSKIATNTYHLYQAAKNKPVLYFPARFDYYKNQELDGYAYALATKTYNKEHKLKKPILISTDAQGKWIQTRGIGTVPHGYLVTFLRDTGEAMLHFARIMPQETKRIALVDVNNNCVEDSLHTARTLFMQYKKEIEAKRKKEAEKYILFGVRPDTAETMIDNSIKKKSKSKKLRGVCPELIKHLRTSLDNGYKDLNLEAKWKQIAKKYFQNIKIIVTGGFHPQKIKLFEKKGIPADYYGVGSYFFGGENNDFTADVVQIKVENTWIPLAKKGRKVRENPLLKKVSL